MRKPCWTSLDFSEELDKLPLTIKTPEVCKHYSRSRFMNFCGILFWWKELNSAVRSIESKVPFRQRKHDSGWRNVQSVSKAAIEKWKSGRRNLDLVKSRPFLYGPHSREPVSEEKTLTWWKSWQLSRSHDDYRNDCIFLLGDECD